MRLEEDEQAAVPAVPQRVQCRGDLGRMMGIVVVDVDASCIAAVLEPPRCAAELCEYACGFLTAHSCELECRERGRCVAPVVLTGNRQRPVVRGELLSAHDRRDVREPAVEELRDLRARTERRVMVEVDVRHDGDAWPQLGDRPVRFVSLHDEPSLPGPGVPAELRDVRADQPGRVAAEPLETEGDHAARRRLAMRARDHDGVAQRHELGEQLRARLPGDASRERGRDERLPALRAAVTARPRSRRRSLRAARGTESAPDPSRAPPPPTPAPARRTHSCPPRRYRRSRICVRQEARAMSSSAISSAASGRASCVIAADISASRADRRAASESTPAPARPPSPGTTTAPPRCSK